MTIKAKEIKTGMTIKDGVWSIVVKSIRHGQQKNGRPTITVRGPQTRLNHKQHVRTKGKYMYKDLPGERTYKTETRVNIY